MAVISYNDFIANVQTADLAMMTEFIQGKRIQALSAPEADALFAQAQRLFEAGILWRVVRGYDQSSGSLVYTFDGYLVPEAAAYVSQAARERVQMSREPLP